MLRSRLIKKYFPANYKDCFRDKIYRKPYMSVNELFNLIVFSISKMDYEDVLYTQLNRKTVWRKNQ